MCTTKFNLLYFGPIFARLQTFLYRFIKIDLVSGVFGNHKLKQQQQHRQKSVSSADENHFVSGAIWCKLGIHSLVLDGLAN